MVTIYDIAKKTGYSPATVSKALNNYSDIGSKTKEAILKIAKEMGYTPNYNAKALITKKSWMIGVLYSVDQGMGLEHPLYGGVVEGFKSRVEEEGYEIIFITRNLGGRPMSYLEHCRHRGVDGVFLTVTNQDDPDVMELINSGITCVSSDFVHPNLPSVISDNKLGSIEGMEYVLSLGHKRIAHIAGPTDHIASVERLEAYKAALLKAGIEYDNNLVAYGSKYDNKTGYNCMKELLAKNKDVPTAVFAACDSIAFGAILAAREAGYLVPEDISFLGFDDYDNAAYFNPPLTTLRQHKRTLGKTAAEVLLTLIRGEEVDNMDIRVPVDLKIRSSCVAVK